MTFYWTGAGTFTGNFTIGNLVNVFSPTSAAQGVAAGNIPIVFSAADNSSALATEVATAINSATSATFTTTAAAVIQSQGFGFNAQPIYQVLLNNATTVTMSTTVPPPLTVTGNGLAGTSPV